MSETATDFQEDAAGGAIDAPGEDERLVVDLEGYEGPIDVLLTLARDQKLDLAEHLDPRAGRPVYRIHRPGAARAARIAADSSSWRRGWRTSNRSAAAYPRRRQGRADRRQMAATLGVPDCSGCRRCRTPACRLMGGPPRQDVFTRGAPEGLRDRRHADLHSDALRTAPGLWRPARAQRRRAADRADELYSMEACASSG